MRTDLIITGALLMFFGALLFFTIIFILFGILLGLVGFVMLIVGLVTSPYERVVVSRAPAAPTTVYVTQQPQQFSEGIKYCIQCGAPNSKSALYCQKCGTKFPE